ncbi:MAG: prephenate dehydratase domain-containing protein [Polyangiaceae bacterium]
MTHGKRELADLRQEMVQIDGQLLNLLDRRARAARRIGELRRDQPAALPLTDHAMLKQLVDRSSGDMPATPLQEILGAIFAACLALELPISVSFVGSESGPAHRAARSRFGQTAPLIAADTPAGSLEEVWRGRAEYAVVPLERSTEGLVHATVDALITHDLRIVEVIDGPFEEQSIRHAIVGRRPSGRTGSDATAFIFGVKRTVGALLEGLQVLAERGVPVLKIHSHPGTELWSYVYFVEAGGHFTDRALVTAFEELKRVGRSFKLLGSYPLLA